jgi:hypothetical protein
VISTLASLNVLNWFATIDKANITIRSGGMSGVSLDAIESPDVKKPMTCDDLQQERNGRVKMEQKALSVRNQSVQLGCLLVIVFLALELVPRAPAQPNATDQSTVDSAKQSPVVSSKTNSAAGALPITSCQYCCLYDQYNNAATDPPVGIGSQKFEPTMPAFDHQTADDFVLTSGFGGMYHRCARDG